MQVTPSEWGWVNTPLVASQWEEALRLHPDAEFVKYLLRGITQGFRIGFDYRRCECRQAVANMTSADDNPTVVDEYLAKWWHWAE